MNLIQITASDDMWNNVIHFARDCSWGAGKSLSQRMSDNAFFDWERVIAALDENNIAGYCTVSKTDCIANIPYTPYIGFLFVDEAYRGHRLSQKLISYAMAYPGVKWKKFLDRNYKATILTKHGVTCVWSLQHVQGHANLNI